MKVISREIVLEESTFHPISRILIDVPMEKYADKNWDSREEYLTELGRHFDEAVKEFSEAVKE